MNMTVSKTIAAPVEKVFAAMADIPNAPSRIPAILKIEMLTPGPVGVGTMFKETRKMFGKEATETMEFTAFEPNQRYVLSADSCGGVHFDTEILFKTEGTGTRVEMNVNAEAKTFASRVMGTLMGWMMKGMMKKCLIADLDGIKKSLTTPV
ncbi:hypothetical protein BH11PLA2_BH11PLA2_15400 [soil metagenome]